MRVWVDASVLIGLDLAGDVGVLKELLERVSVTSDVAREVRTGRESQALRSAFGEWIEIVPLKGNRRRWETLGLGPGEASLFLTPPQDRLVLDDAPARTVAEAEGRAYVGLLGLLMAGVDRKALAPSRARSLLLRLVETGFRISADLQEEVLRAIEGR
jgi:predicted nucleic acid-binding protein